MSSSYVGVLVCKWKSSWTESKSHLEILRQCHWPNCGYDIKACLGLLIMEHHLRRKQFQKSPGFNQYTSFCISVPILNSKVLLCTYCHSHRVIYNCQSTRYVVFNMFDFIGPESKHFTVHFNANPYCGGLCIIIFTPIKVFTIMRKLITRTKNELLTYFNRYNTYHTHNLSIF